VEPTKSSGEAHLGGVCGTLDVCGTGDDEDEDDVVDDEGDDEEEDLEEDEVVEDDESEESESESSDVVCSLCFGGTVGVLTERPGISTRVAEVGDRFRFCARATSTAGELELSKEGCG